MTFIPASMSKRAICARAMSLSSMTNTTFSEGNAGPADADGGSLSFSEGDASPRCAEGGRVTVDPNPDRSDLGEPLCTAS